MKPHAELLGRLQQLNSQDRSWIMQQLSERERAQLLATLEAPDAAQEVAPPVDAEIAKAKHQPAAPSDPKRPDPFKALSKVDPRVVAALLKHEPVWLGAIVLATPDENWGRAILDALPAPQRPEMERMRSHSFGDALVQSVARQVLARCQAEVVPPSAFDRLVERIGASRSKRRLTLHL